MPVLAAARVGIQERPLPQLRLVPRKVSPWVQPATVAQLVPTMALQEEQPASVHCAAPTVALADSLVALGKSQLAVLVVRLGSETSRRAEPQAAQVGSIAVPPGRSRLSPILAVAAHSVAVVHFLLLVQRPTAGMPPATVLAEVVAIRTLPPPVLQAAMVPPVCASSLSTPRRASPRPPSP